MIAHFNAVRPQSLVRNPIIFLKLSSYNQGTKKIIKKITQIRKIYKTAPKVYFPFLQNRVGSAFGFNGSAIVNFKIKFAVTYYTKFATQSL